MPSGNHTFVYTGDEDTIDVGGQSFTRKAPTLVIDNGIASMLRERDDFSEPSAAAHKAKAAVQAGPEAPAAEPAAPEAQAPAAPAPEALHAEKAPKASAKRQPRKAGKA